MDWKALETRLVDTARATLDDWLARGASPLYAVAFHASYREEEHTLGLPSLAANSLAALTADHPGWKEEGFVGVKWNPADWRWDQEPDDAGLTALDAALQAEAHGKGPAHWHKTEARFIATVTRAAKTLAKQFAKDPRVERDFVVFFHDEDGGAELARASIPKARFLRLFPEQDATEQLRREVATRPVPEQVDYYLSRLDSYDGINCEEAQAWLIAHGEAAAPALTERLRAQPDDWQAARLLGATGVSSPESLAALRHALLHGTDESARTWSANALGYMGDFEWLLDKAAEPGLGRLAAEGCCANLRPFRDDNARPLPLDYAPLETLLARHPKLKTVVEKDILRLGGGSCEIGADEVAEVCRGLRSPHASVRRHAAFALDNRRLGKPQRAQAMDALRAARADADPTVARLAGEALASLSR
ncbi:DUF4303 domain-containing protein [Archangium primigenium]|uniref:DUF4303 domain-containing protein n=1 Tax=[Archangium] primigenium TaxID=2792470 RepID=UPI00195832B9|nr:DUF4303 domain-containing protein [Archangium primigenium]MBM7114845.1 DUF4303 domain-containing protein [Archangium primigenium]